MKKSKYGLPLEVEDWCAERDISIEPYERKDENGVVNHGVTINIRDEEDMLVFKLTFYHLFDWKIL